MESYTNISCYKFVPLQGLKALRERLTTQCRAWGLKGTILLSTEGINFFIAGPEKEIHRLLAELRSVDGLQDLAPKFSLSDHQPFNRMLVRIKKEIIAFGVEGIEPAKRPSPKLPARELRKWIEEGRDFTLLDTRNDYEIKLGTFKNALPIGVECFRDFPEAVSALPSSVKEKPVVMFCTGGIRCEKAGPFMEREGFEVFQLDGGILKYFEEVGGEHYDGECFVFDHRVSVDRGLNETGKSLCFACQTPLTEDEQNDRRYVIGKSCPYCFVSSEEQMAKSLEARAQALEVLSSPLPGSTPYRHLRPLNVPLDCDGLLFIDFIAKFLDHIPREIWAVECEQGLILDKEKKTVSRDRRVRAGERYYHLQPEQSEPEVNMQIRFLYEDEALVVVSKPAPLPMHPCGRFNRNTLQWILNQIYAPQTIRPAHRLDANTTGLVVLARTKHFAGLLQPQFSEGNVRKTYLARICGNPPEDSFSSTRPISRAPGQTGSRTTDENGLAAQTDFNVLERAADGTTLLEVTPITGRTNQIRVHLWAMGWPICGDLVYLADGKLGGTQTHSPMDPPLQLCAHRLAFRHPLTQEEVEFTDPVLPDWAEALLLQDRSTARNPDPNAHNASL